MKRLLVLALSTLCLLSSCEKNESTPKITPIVEITPSLLPNHALVNFHENELHTSPIDSFTVKINYLPIDEISVPLIKDEYLRYNLSYTLTGEDGEVEMEHEIINDSTVILSSKKPLISNNNYTLQVFAKWQKKIGEYGTWKDCDAEFNEEISETIITSIPIEKLSITKSDFIFQYPLDRQFNYLKDEYSKGYFRLKNEKQKQLMYYNGAVKIQNVKTGVSNTLQLTYNNNLGVFEYDLQANFLDNESVYEVSLLTPDAQEVLYSYYFKTSKYNTFSEKWDILKTCFKGKWYDNVYNEGYPYSQSSTNLQKINVQIEQETLDYYEINSNRFLGSTMPLIQFETHVPADWDAKAEWRIYSWSTLSFDRKNTDCKKYGFPPLRAIYYLGPDWLSVKLSDNSLTGNIEYPNMPFLGVWIWEVQNFMKADAWSAHLNANEINENERDWYQNTAARNYPGIERLDLNFALGGDVYPLIDVYYVLPGINIETTKIANFQL